MTHVSYYTAPFTCERASSTFFILETSYYTSNFYGLPKDNKSQKTKKGILQQYKEYIDLYEPDLTIRSLAGGRNCPTKP